MKNIRSRMATLLGCATSVCLVFQEKIDFTTLDYKNIGTYFTIIVIAVPAIGGWMSELKPMGKKNEPKP